jgi:hypothetical protein
MTMATLGQQEWTPVGREAVVLAFLQAEWEKWPIFGFADRRLISAPVLDNSLENAVRAILLDRVRGPLLNRIPRSTSWFRVRRLMEAHLNQLRVIARCGWDDASDRNELPSVAARRHMPLI